MKSITWLVGASTGIGAALVDKLAADAETLYISSRSADKLNALAEQHSNVKVLAFDVNDSTARKQAITDIEQQSGRLDCIVLNAGTCEYVDLELGDTDLSLYQRVLDTNFHAPVALTHEALYLLRKSDNARIVGISSSVIFTPLPRSQAYGSSKAAFTYWLSTMAIDLKGEGIRVQIVSPGFVDTPLTQKNDFKMPFLLSPENAAKRIRKGIQRNQTHIHFPWRFTALLLIEGLLPLSWQHALNSKLSRNKADNSKPANTHTKSH